MKTLVIKPFKTYDSLPRIVANICKQETDLLLLDYCVIKQDFAQSILQSDRVTYVQNDFVDVNKLQNYYLQPEYDIVIVADMRECELADDFVAKMVAPFEDENVNMTYSDFSSNGIPHFHMSAPSYIKAYPLFAFRTSIIKESHPDLPVMLSDQTLSVHINSDLVNLL